MCEYQQLVRALRIYTSVSLFYFVLFLSKNEVPRLLHIYILYFVFYILHHMSTLMNFLKNTTVYNFLYMYSIAPPLPPLPQSHVYIVLRENYLSVRS